MTVMSRKAAITCSAALASVAWIALSPATALADDQAATASPPAGAAPAAPAPTPLASPAMGATLSGNSNPFNVDAGPLGKVYVSGVLSGLGMVQTNHSPFDRSDLADLSNGQVFIQTTSGPVQFYLNAGVYSLPSLGAPYVHATTLTSNTYSGLPMAYVKFQPTAEISIEVGKLPTLIGAEATYTFQNMNIERGLLWNQEPVVSDGVQVNYSKGKITLSVSLNDGFYSNRYNWVSGLFTYAFSPKDSLTFAGGGALSTYTKSTFATPVFQNNSDIFNVIYTHTEGPFVVTPYFQYTHVNSGVGGAAQLSADTWSGAILAKYSFNATWSVAGRAEYISSSNGSCSVPAGCLATNILYGPGSKAFSLTLTPTFQKGIFFVRGEASYVDVTSASPGSAFGVDGNAKSQFRGVLETGFIF